MLKLSDDQIMGPALERQAKELAKSSDEVAKAVTSAYPALPSVLVRVNFRMLVASLHRQGVTDLFVACDLAKLYFKAGEKMVTNPWSNRWRQVLTSRDMTEDAKTRELKKLLGTAQKMSDKKSFRDE